MTVGTAFGGSRSVFLDTAPAIYSLSVNSPLYSMTAHAIAHCIASDLRLVVSPVTLAETLAGEMELTRQLTAYDYLTSPEFGMVETDAAIAEVTGHFRRATRLKLPDCLQLATALTAGCDTFLTNDTQLARTSVALRFVLVSDLT